MKKFIIVIEAALLSLLLIACPTETINGPEPLSSNAGISGLTVNGVAATENGGSFGASVPFETSVITITFVPATGATAALGDVPGATFEGMRLSVGANTFSIIITAENGTTAASYTVVVTRDREILPSEIVLVTPADDETNVGPQPTLTWVRSLNAIYWKVFFAEGEYSETPAPSTAPASGFLNSPSWTPPNDLNPSMSYGWKVVPYDATRTALTPSGNRVFKTGDLPVAPLEPTVTPVTDKPHLLIEWTGSIGAKKYKVFRNNDPSPIFISHDAETFSWTDGAPNAGVNTYTVKGTNDFGDSLDSAPASGTPIVGGPAIIIIK
ncbi:MAG: hypothetical protein A2Y38_10830 [Spirochaetes bacterium GWB1_59_5]|nr:MAG: hypothetical protein A2Y38_10830 [Spirochaetes bacterium GWB1_59_5]